jgi:hypothetical protein
MTERFGASQATEATSQKEMWNEKRRNFGRGAA